VKITRSNFPSTALASNEINQYQPLAVHHDRAASNTKWLRYRRSAMTSGHSSGPANLMRDWESDLRVARWIRDQVFWRRMPGIFVVGDVRHGRLSESPRGLGEALSRSHSYIKFSATVSDR